MPRGGGKGGTLLRAHSFKLRHELEALFFTDQFCRTRGTGGVQPENPYNNFLLAETGRTQSETLQRNEVKLMRVATGLTVLALLLALLSQRPPCELASKCKQSVNEWSGTKCSGMSEQSVCYLFGRWSFKN